MARLTIKDLENLTGIKAHTIRIWEQRYQFIKPCRSETNIRYYCADELKLLQDIALLSKAGYKISRINEFSKAELHDRVLELESEEFQRENLVNELTNAMVDLDMEKFQDILEEHASRNGIENSVAELIYPFLSKSGLLWQTGHLHRSNEPLVTCLIRQKLIVAIELTVPKERVEDDFLLFLPEGDHNEIGLLYSYYVLKSRGFDTIYLGDNVPLEDLSHIVSEKKPGRVFMHLVNGDKPFRLDRYLQQFSKKLPSTKIIVSGRPVHPSRTLPPNARIINDVNELFTTILN